MNCPPRSPSRTPGEVGFTLVEILVVLFIVGLMASLAGLRAGLNPRAVLEDESTRLQQTLESGLDRSRLTRTPVLWQASQGGYALTVREEGMDRQVSQHDLATKVKILAVWRDGIPQTPPYELALSGRNPGLFRIKLGTEQAGPFELRSTLPGRVELVRD